jgi:hypothetical protein
MPNGPHPLPTPVRGCNVAPVPLAFNVEKRHAQTAAGPLSVVVLRFEHATGSTELIMPTDFAADVGKAMVAASSGIQIVGN